MTIQELFEAEIAALERARDWATDEDVRDAIADELAELQAVLGRWRMRSAAAAGTSSMR
jgi:hypothetical protein